MNSIGEVKRELIYQINLRIFLNTIELDTPANFNGTTTKKG